MRVGISTATFFGKALTEDSFELIKDAGAEVCEVFLTTFTEYEEDFGKLLLSRLNGLEVHSVHTLTNQFEPQLHNEAERTRRDAENMFRKTLSTMKLLGGHYYTYHGPSVLKPSQRKVNFQKMGTRMNELTEIVSSYGGELCLENVHWTNYNKPGFFRGLKEYAPKLRACLDIKQAMQAGEDYKSFLSEMGSDLRTVHICDYDGDKLYPTGFGSFDFAELRDRLIDVGYDGDIFIELYSGDYPDFSVVNEAVYRMKNIFEK